MSEKKLLSDGIEFKSTLPIQVRFNDIDVLGHINNNVYLSYFDLAKAEYFEAVRGTSLSWIEGNIVIARLEVDYLAPTFYKEEVVVDTAVVHLGDKSGVFIQQLRNVKKNQIKCVAKSVFVFIDSDKQVPASIPYVWRERIGAYEGKEF